VVQKYPIRSIEDGLAENDWEGWAKLTAKLGDKVQLVGDDLFVTNKKFVERGVKEQSANAVLVKVNQIGTLSETFDAVNLRHAQPLRLRPEPPLGRDRGRHHRRHRRRDQLRPDQDRRPLPLRPQRQVQPVAPHRRGTWGFGGLWCGDLVAVNAESGRIIT
jgi:hypothetical protein